MDSMINQTQTSDLNQIPPKEFSHTLYTSKKRIFLLLSIILVTLLVVVIIFWTRKALAPKPLSEEEKRDILSNLQMAKPDDGSPYLSENDRENIMKAVRNQSSKVIPNKK